MFTSSVQENEIRNWIEVSHAVSKAYFEFIRDGKDSHRFAFNERNIEIVFFKSDDNSGTELWCPETEHGYKYLYKDEKNMLTNVTFNVFALAWDALNSEYYTIDESDSKKEFASIRKIISDFKIRAYDTWYTSNISGCWCGNQYQVCTIELGGRQINAGFEANGIDETKTNVYLRCLDTKRTVFHIIEDTEDIDKIASDIQYLSLEPEIIRIDSSDYSEESVQIKEVICPAISGSTYARYMGFDADERIIEQHGRQIKVQFKSLDDCIAVSLDCITNGKSDCCTVKKFDGNPDELVEKIQELAWMD